MEQIASKVVRHPLYSALRQQVAPNDWRVTASLS
jgi:hypothetical protein